MSNSTSNWWSTLPGILTGVATLITATGSFIVILNTAGCFKEHDYEKPDLKPYTRTQQEPAKPEVAASRIRRISGSFTPGKFPQSSDRRLSPEDVGQLSSYDLKIMRNEIFARHGYIFTKPELQSYFQGQSWYTAQDADVTSFLTDIEEENIALIKQYE